VCCHSASFAVILSAAKDLALATQDKLRDGAREFAGVNERKNYRGSSPKMRAQNDSASDGESK